MRGSRAVVLMFALIVASLLTASVAAWAKSIGDQGGRPITVEMTGAAEKPSPGDPDGSGLAEFTVNPGQGEVCWTLTVENIAPASAAHIHRAPSTEAGPVVVHLSAPTDGTSTGCTSVDRALAKD